MKRVSGLILPAFLLSLLAACGGSADSPAPQIPALLPVAGSVQPLTALPADGLQPWEELDAQGHAVPRARSLSSITVNTVFTPGVERFLAAGDVAANGEALRLNGGSGNDNAYAIYRIGLQDEQPAVVSVDANLLGPDSHYYVGVSNYGGVRWEWTGPFREGSIRLPVVTDGNGDYTSGLGNTFVTVLAEPGSALDIVGIGVNQYEPTDASFPPAPAGLSLTPVNGGLELQWSPVAVSDLAGYIVYHSDNSFSNPHSVGVKRLRWLEGSTRLVLGGLTKRQFVAVSALDFGGNESPPTTVLSAQPLPGDPGKLNLSVSGVSGGINVPLNLTATGGAIYDWDLDGDGIFEITGDLTGSRQAYTGQSGVIRPRVRSRDGSGTAVALGSVSLLIIGNNRPVASATADPQSGPAPLSVQFKGIAEDLEDDLSALTFAWDFNGDGIYENDNDLLQPAVQQYAIDGTWNARFRVTDSEGAWDVDSVAVTVGPGLGGWPTAVLMASPERGQKLVPFQFDASASHDQGGAITDYEWDIDGDGLFSEASTLEEDFQGLAQISLSSDSVGLLPVAVRVHDADGHTDMAMVQVTVAGWQVTKLNIGIEAVTEIAMLEVAGHPAMFYYDNDSDDLLFNRAQDEFGSSWGGNLLITGDSFVRGPRSVAIIAGNPAIAYDSSGSGGLRYSRASNPEGSSWGASQLLDASGSAGNISLTTVAGNPAIAYRFGGSLRYIRAQDAVGAAWNAFVTVDTLENPGNYCSLAVVNGRPAIAHRNSTGDDAVYVQALDSFGDSWNSRVVLDTTGNTGYFMNLVVANGVPAVSYRNITSGITNYMHALDPDGRNWAVPVQVETVSQTGMDPFLLVHEGLPCMFLSDRINHKIVLSRGLDGLGSSWSEPVLVDESPVTNLGYPCAISLDGRLAVGYYDLADSDLRFAILF
ncbi:MAG: PKD domain-containing protein [bacterium]